MLYYKYTRLIKGSYTKSFSLLQYTIPMELLGQCNVPFSEPYDSQLLRLLHPEPSLRVSSGLVRSVISQDLPAGQAITEAKGVGWGVAMECTTKTLETPTITRNSKESCDKDKVLLKRTGENRVLQSLVLVGSFRTAYLLQVHQLSILTSSSSPVPRGIQLNQVAFLTNLLPNTFPNMAWS